MRACMHAVAMAYSKVQQLRARRSGQWVHTAMHPSCGMPAVYKIYDEPYCNLQQYIYTIAWECACNGGSHNTPKHSKLFEHVQVH